MKFVFLIFPFIFLSSCMTYSSGYIPTVKIDFKTTKNLAKNKKDVSFSTSYYQQVGEDILVSDKKLQKSILNSFNKSGLFKRVYYTPLKEKSDYHYHFDVKITGTNPVSQPVHGLFASLCVRRYSLGETPNRRLNMREKLRISGYPVESAACPGV